MLLHPGFRDYRAIVIGGGAAGLATALRLSPAPVLVVSKGKVGATEATALAQGGIAAAVGADDHADLHAQDTLAVAADLADPKVVQMVTKGASDAIMWLQDLGVQFDNDDSGLVLGREAGHRVNRILHAGGDSTGAELHRALLKAACNTPSITLAPWLTARGLAVADGSVAGVYISDGDVTSTFASPAVVMATGGIGGLYAHTTNPSSALGEGLAMAAMAGAALVDLEFVQFHPTAILSDADPLPLATEAIRGAGAILINDQRQRFMETIHRDGDLAPRDIVARAVEHQYRSGRRVYLDACQAVGGDFPRRFPTVHKSCLALGIDPRNNPIPVRPAAHYHMGGIAVDSCGRSTLPGLWANGEVAATGLHGGNRLASNSLLEAIVFAQRIAEDILSREASGAVHLPVWRSQRPLKGSPDADGRALHKLRTIMSHNVGLIRSEALLIEGLRHLASIRNTAGSSMIEHASITAIVVAVAALRRKESRGAHFRVDQPDLRQPAHRQMITLDDALETLLTAEQHSSQRA